MDRLDAMAVFLATVEAGSLSAAARKLDMPLATVSRKLGELERHLKARLLNRSTRRLDLTDAGREYLAACRRILEQVDDAEREVAGEFSEPRGGLVVTAPLVFGRLHVLPVIADFLQAYPKVDVRLLQSDRNVDLLDEHVDVAVRIGTLPDSRLKATPLGAISRVVCASPDYLARHGAPAHPNELAGHTCVTFEALGSASAWTFLIDGREVSVPVHSRLLVNTAEAAIDAALSGVGLTRVLSYQVDDAVRAGRLEIVLPDFPSATMAVNLVHAGQQRLALKLRTFLDFAAPRLRKRLGPLSTQTAVTTAR